MKKLGVLIGFLSLVGSAIGMGGATGNQAPRASFETMPLPALENIGSRLSGENFLNFIKVVPGADRNAVIWSYFQNSTNPTALIKALEVRDKEALGYILTAIKENPGHNLNLNAQDDMGSTALMWVASRGHTEIVKALIDAGVELNIQANVGWTALIYAAVGGHTEVVNALIAAGAE